MTKYAKLILSCAVAASTIGFTGYLLTPSHAQNERPPSVSISFSLQGSEANFNSRLSNVMHQGIDRIDVQLRPNTTSLMPTFGKWLAQIYKTEGEIRAVTTDGDAFSWIDLIPVVGSLVRVAVCDVFEWKAGCNFLGGVGEAAGQVSDSLKLKSDYSFLDPAKNYHAVVYFRTTTMVVNGQTGDVNCFSAVEFYKRGGAAWNAWLKSPNGARSKAMDAGQIEAMTSGAVVACT